MNHFFSIILTAILCAEAAAQSVKSLGYNSTNGQVVAATNVVWTNAFNFSTNSVAASVRANLGFSTNLNTLWTATNAASVLSFLDLESSSEPTFLSVTLSEGVDSFVLTAFAQGNRENLGLPLAALTNTSNVTMMRALAGSTNTNHPYSGNISVTGTNNTNTLVFSNGILVEVQ